MSNSENDNFEAELKAGFLEEASQLLANAEQCFLALESQPNDPAILDNIFRIAHNVKGSSRAVGFDALGAFTHEFESFLLKCKSGQIPLTESTISLLLKCNDHVNLWVDSLKKDHAATLSNDELIQEIHHFNPVSPAAETAKPETPSQATASEGAENQAPAVDEESPPPPSSHSGFEEAEAVEPEEQVASEPAIVAAPAPAPAQTPANKPAASKPVAGVVDESIRVSLARLEKLLNYIGEMVILQTVLREQSFAENPTLLRRTIHQMGKVTKEIQDISMSLRMVPVKQTFQKMQRIVRDTGGALGKKVNLTLMGEETEVDKTILESLSDPLVHLIRNAVDHGVETPEIRAKSGKPERGEIVLSATHQGGNLVIEIRDDGAGIDAEKLKKKAREKGILRPDANLSDQDAYGLIFHSGFSTKEVVTDVSGRGVGMDVVKTNIEQLQGEVQIETVLGKGTCFRVRLPLTLAIIDGMMIRNQNERYVVPLSHVHESLRPREEDIHFVTGVGEMLVLRGENIPLFRLDALLGTKAEKRSIEDTTVIVIRTEGTAFCVMVDDIIGQSQVVIKQLGAEHQNMRGIGGSAILGDGKPALILELNELIKRGKPGVRGKAEPRRMTA